jgi:hypothetical protein
MGLEGDGVSATRPGRFIPGKTLYLLYSMLDGLQAQSGRVRKVSPPTGIRSLDRPARSQSLYRLSYPAHTSTSRLVYYIVVGLTSFYRPRGPLGTVAV